MNTTDRGKTVFNHLNVKQNLYKEAVIFLEVQSCVSGWWLTLSKKDNREFKKR